jgi:phosphoglycolate phosphatase-like HAD superfamily hydrolase
MTTRLVWLFDVDGTLISTDGAAREAFAAAARECWGIEDDFRDIPFAGRTDPGILADILRKHGLRAGEDVESRFWSAVFAAMEVRLRPGRGRVLGGVARLLEALSSRPEWVSALLTGNSAGMARVKLTHFGLAHRFAFGAFGDEGRDRNAVARLAVERAVERYHVVPGRCLVIGDTEHDVACARAAGARAVAVASGIRSLAELEPHAPDLLLPSLEPVEPLVAWAEAIESAS